MPTPKLVAAAKLLTKKFAKLNKANKELVECQLKYKCISQEILDERRKMLEYTKEKLKNPEKMTDKQIRTVLKTVLSKATDLLKLSVKQNSVRCTIDKCKENLLRAVKSTR